MSESSFDTITLDIAMLCEEYTPIEVVCNNYHIVELDEISISEDMFKKIFYPYGETFGIEDKVCKNDLLYEYITFLSPWRSINNGKPFSLLEQIILNIENDLNVTRNCFTTCSLIELSKELSNIKTLCDINCKKIVCSLTWSNIISIIKNDYINNTSSSIRETILVISVVFKTPNSCILPTIIKFKYKISLMIE